MLVQKIINRLPSFQKYPVRVHRLLAKNISFDEIDEGRVVIRAGHVGTCFYSVISGRLAVTIPATDRTTGDVICIICLPLNQQINHQSINKLINQRVDLGVENHKNTKMTAI